MIKIQEILDKVKVDLGNYNSRVLRNAYASRELTGEGNAIVTVLVELINKENEDIRNEIKEALNVVNELKEFINNYDESSDIQE